MPAAGGKMYIRIPPPIRVRNLLRGGILSWNTIDGRFFLPMSGKLFLKLPETSKIICPNTPSY